MSIAVLISGRGSNLRAIAEAGLPVSVVVGSCRDAPGLHYAARRNIRTAVADNDEQLARVLVQTSPRIVALAGFMRILGGDIVRAFGGRMTNIHPSLLPKYRGLHTHRRVLADGESEHGCTVHWLSEGVDEGKIIAQNRVPVLPGDDEESLAARVLAAEHKLYPEVLRRLLSPAAKAAKVA